MRLHAAVLVAAIAACDASTTATGGGAPGAAGTGGGGGGGGAGATGGGGGSTPGFSLSAGSSGDETGSRLVVADNGDIIVSGTFDATLDLGGGALTATGRDGFVARFDAGGELVWARQWGGSGGVGPIELALDPGGDVLCAANFTLEIDLGAGATQSAGAADVLVAKLTGASGEPVWQRAFGGSSDAFAGGVAADGAGNVFVSGIFQGTLDLGFGTPLDADGGVDVFLVALEPTGAGRWHKRLGGPGATDGASNVGAGDDGAITLAGFFGGAADFGAGPVMSAGTRDIFVVRYDTAGAFVDFAAFPFEGSNYLDGFETRVAPDGAVLLAGQFGASVTFGATTLSGSDDQNDVYLARLDPALVPLSASSHGGAGENHVRGTALGPRGDISLGSVALGAVDFGGGTLAGMSALVRLEADGAHVASRVLGGALAVSPEAVAESADGAWLVTGAFTEPIDLGHGPLPHAGGGDFFLAKIYR